MLGTGLTWTDFMDKICGPCFEEVCREEGDTEAQQCQCNVTSIVLKVVPGVFEPKDEQSNQPRWRAWLS